MNIKAAIFDYDGTIMDSMGFWDNIGELILKKLDIPVYEGFRERFFVMSQKEAARVFREEFGVNKSEKEIIDLINNLADEYYKNEAMPKKGAIELLKKYKSKGIKLALATASIREHIILSATRLGFYDLFDAIYTCTELDTTKNSPLIYNTAAMELGFLPKEIAVFEDSVVACHTAKDAGFYTIGVYDSSQAYNEKEMREFCDEYTLDFSDIF